jgi:hypothetical protein
MLIRQVALLSKTKKIAPDELMRVSAALQRQVTRDLYPIWNIHATVDSFSSEADVPPGYWKIRVMDKVPEKNVGGFHFDEQGQPEADVLWSPTWSLAVSHECLEMLVDPFGHQTAAGPSPNPNQGRVNFLVEVCDPCEAPAFAYKINTGTSNEVLVSDFCTPEYFAPALSSRVRYSFSGSIRAPRQVLTGGYLSWWNPADGHIWQLFGPAEMGNFLDQGAGTLNRETTDGHSRLTRRKHGGKPPKPVRKVLVMADATTLCNLTPDSGLLRGTAEFSTTVQIKDASGDVMFKTISYNGSDLGSNVASATFAIVSGRNDLNFLYEASANGDQITLEDPCGHLLAVLPSDPGNRPTTIKVVA